MKKFNAFSLALLTTASVFGQAPTRVAPASVINARATYGPRFEQLMSTTNESMLNARQVATPSTHVVSASNKTNALNPVQLGTASNAYSILRGEQNQVVAIDSLDLVAFVHRNDVTVFGGGSTASGKLRYDLSIDRGASFTNDIGEINPTYTRPARYPNMAGYSAAGNTNPYGAKFMISAPTLDPSPDWDGHLTGVADVAAATPASTEHYDFIGTGTYLPGGLCQGLDGEFWSVDLSWDGSATSTPWLNKGVYNGTDISWTQSSVALNFNTSFDGSEYITGGNVAFSPDGNTGWMCFLSDIVGGKDSTMNPVFLKSTDGGATWGNPMEVDLDAIAWIKDTLQTLWVDSLGNPASSGIATCAFDYDLTVDVNGNPHMAVVIGTGSDGSGSAYSIYSGLAKFLGDVTTNDGGATWDCHYIHPVYTFRGEFGVPDAQGNLISQDNQPQISRNEAGTHIFFSWVDSDTSGSSGVGFGVSDNIAPQLRVAAEEVSTGTVFGYQNITGGDLVWDGKAMWPTLAPIVFENSSVEWELPLVVLDMFNGDQGQPCRFWYFGADILVVGDNQPVDMPSATLHQSVPNPTSGVASIKFELPSATNVTMDVVNMYGQTVATLANGKYAAGSHVVEINTQELAAGIYFYNLRMGSEVISKKMVVVK